MVLDELGLLAELEVLLGELEALPELFPSGAVDVAAMAAGAIKVRPATAVTSTFTRRVGVCRIILSSLGLKSDPRGRDLLLPLFSRYYPKNTSSNSSFIKNLQAVVRTAPQGRASTMAAGPPP